MHMSECRLRVFDVFMTGNSKSNHLDASVCVCVCGGGGGGGFFVWSFVVLFSSCRVVCGVVLLLLCVCVCDLFLFSQRVVLVVIVCLCVKWFLLRRTGQL